MVGSCLSLVPFYKGYLRRTFTSAGLSQQTIDTDSQTTIHFWAPNNNAMSKPALVLLHGFGPNTFWQWQHQVPFFAPHFALYIPDLIFYGESITYFQERSVVFQAKTVAKMLEKLGVEKYSLLGSCYGGFVAYDMAKMWPDRVEKVIFANCALNWKQTDQNDLLALGKVERLEDVLMPKTGKQFRILLGLSMVKHPPVPDFIIQDVAKSLFGENREEKVELLKAIQFPQNEAKCAPLQQEPLLIWGQYDQIFRLEKGFELQKLLGDKVILEVVKNTAHFPQVEDPNRFNQIVMKFLCRAS